MEDLKTIGRVTGVCFLALAVLGMFGVLVISPVLVDDVGLFRRPTDLTDRAALARVVILLLGIVAAQALTAVWFYRLLHGAGAPWAGFVVAVFGVMTAAAVMTSATFMGVAAETLVHAPGEAAGTVGLLYLLGANSWSLGGLFFGLQLIPMGWAALATRRFPPALGWVVVVGGACHVASGVLAVGLADPPARVVDGLTVPGIVGAFWMIAYLLVRGVRSELLSRTPDGRN